MFVPHLKKKLDVLYQHHPKIHTHKTLAHNLNIRANNIATWIHGNDLRQPDLLPDRHINKILSIFGVTSEQLELKSLDEFKHQFSETSITEKSSKWAELLQQAQINHALYIESQLPDKKFNLPSDEADTPLEQYIVGGDVLIKLALDDEWAKRAQQGQAYLVLLNSSLTNMQCLCPSNSKYAPHYKLSNNTVTVPVKQDAEDQIYAQVSEPVGEQTTYALLTTQPLSDTTYQQLQTSKQQVSDSLLASIAKQVLSNNTMDWALIKKPYEVMR